MKTRLPTSSEIRELVSFLPRLYGEGFIPIREWGGGTENEDGALVMPWPVYEEAVEEFFKVASSEYWTDYGYSPQLAGAMLENYEFVASADLAEIRTMLTYCVRGERFGEGHWGAMIDGGNIRRLLQRLAELESEVG